MIELVKRLKKEREKNRLTQQEVANIIGKTLGHYQKIEKGKINISCQTLLLFAEKYNVSTDYLLGRTENDSPFYKGDNE